MTHAMLYCVNLDSKHQQNNATRTSNISDSNLSRTVHIKHLWKCVHHEEYICI